MPDATNANRTSSIMNIMSSVADSGLAFANRYEVILSIPRAVKAIDLANISLRCDSINIPGKAFSTSQYRIYGPARTMPYEVTYSGELTLSVILSADMRERRVFESWTTLVSNPENFKMGYYNNYVADNMLIRILTKADTVVYEAVVEEVYPKSIGDLQLGYEKDNEILRQDITLAYRKYTPNFYTQNLTGIVGQ